MENRLILGIDNSMDLLTLVVSIGDSLIEERHISNKRPPSQILASEVSQMLVTNGYKLPDVKHIFVTLGPGSFTGIRVGLSFAKGLHAGTKIPITGIPTLDVLVHPFSFIERHYICPVIDAKKHEVFTSLYYVSHGKVERIKAFFAIKPYNLPNFIKTPCILLGNGIDFCREVVSSLDGVTLIDNDFSRISGEALIKEGLRLIKENSMAGTDPIYCRRSDAEIKFNISITKDATS